MKRLSITFLLLSICICSYSMTYSDAISYINQLVKVLNDNIQSMRAEQMYIESYEVKNNSFITNNVVNEDIMTVDDFYNSLLRDKPWAFYFNQGLKDLCEALVTANMTYSHHIRGSKSNKVKVLTLSTSDIKKYADSKSSKEELAQALLVSLKSDIPLDLGNGLTKTDVTLSKTHMTFVLYNDESYCPQNIITKEYFYAFLNSFKQNQMTKSIISIIANQIDRGFKLVIKSKNKKETKEYSISCKELREFLYY